MINWDQFEQLVVNNLNRDIEINKNPEQHSAISLPFNQSLFIVAGPGSGKTTVVVLKILKFILVDDLDPSNVVAITFTRKAASELKSRILGWGDKLKQVLLNNSGYSQIHRQVGSLDFNQIIIGTLDSITEDALGEYRAPGTPKPVVIEDFVANALMTRVGLFDHGRFTNPDLIDYIRERKGLNREPNVPEMSEALLEIKDKFFYYQVDIDAYKRNHVHPGALVACDAILDYRHELVEEKILFDFALLETEFLSQLRVGKLNQFLKKIKFVLVDEYQDTNLLQEQIYMEFTKAALRNNGSITIVGDDDQSLYRFRGATVDLFQEFQSKFNNHIGLSSKKIYLLKNYRSTPNIVNFCNQFVLLDRSYQNSRVKSKPQITTSRSLPFENYPIIGIFRNNIHTLAADLAFFIHSVVHGRGVQTQDNIGNIFNIEINPTSGSPSDIVFLCSSPQELKYNGEGRLPFFLRNELLNLSPQIQVFNPRGQSLEKIRDVQVLCGLILKCIDSDKSVRASMDLPRFVIQIFEQWELNADRHITNNPVPRNKISLEKFVNAWGKRNPTGKRTWQREVSLNELIYKLVTWIPSMQDDVEGLVYLEAITRTVTQSTLFGSFGSEIVYDPLDQKLSKSSVKEAIRNILIPIAAGSIKIDEDLLETLPKNRLNLMSIHQSKGLEFPVVIVDVGSDFKTKHQSQEFKRYPMTGNTACDMEDDMRNYSPLGKNTRSTTDRAFDDLIRQYFVAYSRPMDLLILVGLNSCKDGYPLSSGRIKYIPNISTGWDRYETWHWGEGLRNLIHI